MIFLVIRIVAFGMRAYLDSGAISPSDNNYLNLVITELVLLSIGVVFVMKLLVRLYESVLPKLRAQFSHGPDLFERCLIERTRFFLTPLIVLVVVGAIMSTPDHSESDQNTGLALRKVGVSLLLVLGLWYWFAAYTYRNRYPGNSRAFTIALLATTAFDISLIYKFIYTFYSAAQNVTGVFFIFTPLMEMAGLCVLSVDLQSYFLGHPFPNEMEIQPMANNGYQSQPAGY
ncbi:hypothetical protein BGZ58_000223 [Dissophora ornata]|nr:hypothetical protein BGZ58_000223 [Dissophora ornata]